MNSSYIEQLIEDCYSKQDSLNIWEIDYITEMENLFLKDGVLTEGQIEKLEEFINKW